MKSDEATEVANGYPGRDVGGLVPASSDLAGHGDDGQRGTATTTAGLPVPQLLGALVRGLRELLWLLGCRGSTQAALCQQRL